ncbi:MAG: phenylalanine--tRNA ligase subunit beta, partial [Lentisphaerae bacterium]|nr:phenylalanine--tRNA ligase subunit beta [Lentisphaerota bacterium]
MKVPVSWLREYVECDLSASELAERLTFSGTEVVAMATSGDECPGVIVGEVTAIEPHPQADNLVLCDVSDGKVSRRVVCGASNFSGGDKVAFAPPGTMLPGDRRIEETVVRGQASAGMLCAEDELGLSDDHEGILVLDADAVAGTSLSDAIGPVDTVLELEITWNRPDCLSVIGLAREVAAILRVPLRVPDVTFPEGSEGVESRASVSVEDEIGCPRYTARILTNVRDGRAPFWMRRRLRLSGVRPLGTVVDITNYVMLECGHPLHAFDHQRLGEGRIVVRRARKEERIVTLDGVERKLAGDTLVIADASAAVAVAGVMGGEGSEIHAGTETVLLESASFDPAVIRSCSSRLSLSTESSHRFERGVDVMGVDWASRRAAQLMTAHAGATVARGVLDVFPGHPEDRIVRCRFERTRNLLGIDVGGDEIGAIFQALGMTVTDRDDDACTVLVPSFRPDIVIEADLLEEVARIHGLSQVPEAPPTNCVADEADNTEARAAAACRNALVGLGLREIVNYTFASPGLLDEFGGEDAKRRVALPNPVSSEQSVLRPSLLPMIATALGGNAARQVSDMGVFEMGNVFARGGDGSISEKELV